MTRSSLLWVLTLWYWKRSSMLCEIRKFFSFSRWFKSCSQNLWRIFELVFLWRCWSHQCESLYFWKSTRLKMYFRFREVHSIISMNENKKKISFEKKNYFLCLMICFFEKKKSFFFVFHRNISSRYFDCHKNVNRRLWFRFKRWCIVKRKQLRFFWWWNFFFHHRFRDNMLFKIIQNEFSYWNLVVLLFIAVFKYLHEDRTIRYIKLFFFFFKKIDFFVCIEKIRFIEDNVAIIIYVVFLWISDSKDIDEVIFYQIFDECSRFYFFISFEYIYFFEKWKRFAIKNFEMNNFISNWFLQQFLHEHQWWISIQNLRRRLIQYVRSDEITFRIEIFWHFNMFFDAFCFFD
jgi:hypothetical protein